MNLSEMGFNIKNNYGPNIEVKDGGKLTLVQGKDGMWHTADVEEAEVVEELSADMDQEGVEEPEEKVELGEDAVTDLVEKLKPIFFNNKNDVIQFLKEISGMSPNNITDLVNKWVQGKRISDYGSSRKGDLWKILHDAKLYPRTIQNWNRRVQ